MEQYKAYLFDCDGTLIDTTELIYQCFVYSCRKFGNISVTRDQVFANIGIPLRTQLQQFLDPLSDEKASEITSAHMEFQLSIYNDHLQLFPGISETLSQLKDKGKKLAVVTSRKTHTLSLFFPSLIFYALL